MMTLEEKYIKVRDLVKVTLKQLQQEYFTNLRSVFDDTNNVFAGSNLQFKTGSFFKSFKGKIEQRGIDGVVSIASGHPGARIHEVGGFIRAKKFKLTKNRQIPTMASFFWHKYFQTKLEEYKIIALSVIKKQGVNIPSRQYLSRAAEKYDKDLKAVADEFVNKFIEIIEQ